jgi:uncharacterized damage-inducible protein DinB
MTPENQMAVETDNLLTVYHGWDSYQQSLLAAVAPLTPEQLGWRPAPHLRPVGEVVRHIALGRVNWFMRMDAPGSRALADRIDDWEEDPHGNRYVIEDAVVDAGDHAGLTGWLKASGEMIDQTLRQWTLADLQRTFRHTWRGQEYDIPYQWVLWRIMAHDIHHGGELVAMLGMQGLETFELGDLGGHLVEPPLAE